MKTFFHILVLLVLSFTIVSCSVDATEEMEFIEQATAEYEVSDSVFDVVRAEKQIDYANVRIGMYGSMSGYNIQVVRVWSNDTIAGGQHLNFGAALEGATLSENRRDAIFDNEGGEYNIFPACSLNQGITLHLSFVLQSLDGESLSIDDVAYTLEPEGINWEAGIYYDLLIHVSKDMFNLQPITFSASVAGNVEA